MNGFVKIDRKIINWEWYTHPNTARLFFHLLLLANYMSQRWMGIEILPGQLVTGRKKLSFDLKLSEQEIRTSLNKLKSTNEITILSTSKFSIITICKWGYYQGGICDKQPTYQPANQLLSNQQPTTIEEGKEKKKRERVKFTPPTLSEIELYFSEKIKEKGLRLNPRIEAEKFESFYSSKNWMVGKNKMADWNKAINGWIARDKTVETPKQEIKLNLNTKW